MASNIKRPAPALPDRRAVSKKEVLIMKKQQTVNRDKLIHIRVSEGEEKIIKLNAGYVNMNVSKYIRTAAIEPKIVKYDYTLMNEHYHIISEHTKEIAEVRNSINRLIFSIEASNNYLPREIETIVFYMNEIFKSENKLLATMRKKRYKDDSKNEKKADTYDFSQGVVPDFDDDAW